MDIAASEFDIASLVTEAVATVRPNAEKNGSKLKLDVDPAIGRFTRTRSRNSIGVC